jgi:hypothetical protein
MRLQRLTQIGSTITLTMDSVRTGECACSTTKCMWNTYIIEVYMRESAEKHGLMLSAGRDGSTGVC